MKTRWLVLALTFSAACTGKDPVADAGEDVPRCTTPFAGNQSLPPEIEVVAMGDAFAVAPVVEGGPLPLMYPPQGGRVSFVGVRAKNVDPCTVRITGSLRDPVSRLVRLDERTVNLRLVDGGMAQSQPGVINTWTNISACPNQWAHQDLFDQPYELEFTIEERSGRKNHQTFHITPYCAEPANEEECRCQCRLGYQNGDTCETDGGHRDAGKRDAQ